MFLGHTEHGRYACSCRQTSATKAKTVNKLPNMSDDSSDEERASVAAAANEGVAAVLATATAGVMRGGIQAGQGAAGGSQAQLRRRNRPPAAATDASGRSTAVGQGSLDSRVALGDRSTCDGGMTDDEWSPFKGA